MTVERRRDLLAIVIAALCAAIIGAVPALGSTVVGSTAFTVSGTRILHEPPFPEQLLPGYFAGATISRVDIGVRRRSSPPSRSH